MCSVLCRETGTGNLTDDKSIVGYSCKFVQRSVQGNEKLGYQCYWDYL